MIDLELRLANLVSLLSPAAKPGFTGPLKRGENIDARPVDAIRALAKTEGLMS